MYIYIERYMWRFPPVIIHFRFSDFHFPMEINRVSLGLPDLRHAATTSWKSVPMAVQYSCDKNGIIS